MNQQVMLGAPATLRMQLLDQDGNPRPALGAITVTVTRSDGTVLAGGATATVNPEGLATVELTPVDTAELDLLAVTWAETNGAVLSTTVEVIGGYFFSVPEARASSVRLRDETKYPDAEVIAARRAVMESCQRITGRSFVPRFRRLRLNGRFNDSILLPDYDIRRLRSTAVDGYAADLVLSGSFVRHPGISLFNYGDNNVDVAYEYGLDSPPERIKDAALLHLQSLINLTKSGVPDRAEYQIVEGRIFALNKLRGGLTGIKDVDNAYLEWAAPGRTVASVPTI